MRNIVLWVLYLLAASAAVGREPVDELPEPDFSLLASSDFEIRKEIQLSAIPWIASDPAYARQKLLRRYHESSQPEAKARLLILLERAYFPPTQGYLGITMGVPPRQVSNGILILDVIKGSQAEMHGLQINDLILKVGDWEAQRSRNIARLFQEQIQSYRPGSRIKLTILRGDKELVINFRLGVFPTPSEQLRKMNQQQRRFNSIALQRKLEEFENWFREESQKYHKIL